MSLCMHVPVALRQSSVRAGLWHAQLFGCGHSAWCFRLLSALFKGVVSLSIMLCCALFFFPHFLLFLFLSFFSFPLHDLHLPNVMSDTVTLHMSV